MQFRKILTALCLVFFAIFLLSAVLIVTNLKNMWLPAIVSLPMGILCLVVLKLTKKNPA